VKKLQVLCPQEYEGSTLMNVVPCKRCQHWVKPLSRCSVDTGAEHLPDEPPEKVPTCPIQDRCQHQIQAPIGEPCVVRKKGCICESALIYSGLSRADAMSHDLGFNAGMVASPKEIAEYMADQGASSEEVAAYLAKWDP